jgi:hypothetical protein
VVILSSTCRLIAAYARYRFQRSRSLQMCREGMTMQGSKVSSSFRKVFGHYPTSVCAVTASHEGEPVGLIVGSFTSVSFHPPLAGFLPPRSLRSWQRIHAAGPFCINVLGNISLTYVRPCAEKLGTSLRGWRNDRPPRELRRSRVRWPGSIAQCKMCMMPEIISPSSPMFRRLLPLMEVALSCFFAAATAGSTGWLALRFR